VLVLIVVVVVLEGIASISRSNGQQSHAECAGFPIRLPSSILLEDCHKPWKRHPTKAPL
jgi:hypothetical protein